MEFSNDPASLKLTGRPAVPAVPALWHPADLTEQAQKVIGYADAAISEHLDAIRAFQQASHAVQESLTWGSERTLRRHLDHLTGLLIYGRAAISGFDREDDLSGDDDEEVIRQTADRA
ncbi:MAG: hypothetical protein SFU56_14745 [Capsulimonadales bacterium]|nr:hypothetical protein [Capsulimonadales bacterium]